MCRCSSIAWRIVVRVQLDVAHDLGEHVPFDLREREEDMFVGEQRVLAPPRLFDGAVDDALRRFTNLARRDVEVFYVHGCLRLNSERQQDRAVPQASGEGSQVDVAVDRPRYLKRHTTVSRGYSAVGCR